MVFIIGASSLRNTIVALPYHERRQFNGRTFSDGGLSFNSQNPDKKKVLHNLLNRGSLSRKKNIVIWHDLINNTVTPYRRKNSPSPVIPPLPIPNLLSILKSLKDRIAAVVYIQRFEDPQILQNLRSTKIITIDAFKQLISHRNRKNKILICNLRILHPKIINEARLLIALWSSRQNLKQFGPEKFKNKKKKKPSQKKEL